MVGEGEQRLIFALPADAAVQAETALRDFMQTLTKTFAHLHVGLAIFDQQRQLQLFNPALLDLTGLPVDFLSMRPSLLSVLDAMRDRNMIPEPKDYRGWRRQLVELEKAAASGLYEETWSLPGGQTYRVIGRPHPNGAIALMFEDISGEMLRTRRYRADLELGQSVIDQMDEAIAVFSEGGQLVMSNACLYPYLGRRSVGHAGRCQPAVAVRPVAAAKRAQPGVERAGGFCGQSGRPQHLAGRGAVAGRAADRLPLCAAVGRGDADRVPHPRCRRQAQGPAGGWVRALKRA